MFICIIYAITVESCTTIIGGKRSTSDGSTFVTHNNDCTDCDIRLGLVPSTHNRDNNSLTVNTCKFTYPRYIGSDRGTTYTYDHSSLEHIHNDYLLESTCTLNGYTSLDTGDHCADGLTRSNTRHVRRSFHPPVVLAISLPSGAYAAVKSNESLSRLLINPLLYATSIILSLYKKYSLSLKLI